MWYLSSRTIGWIISPLTGLALVTVGVDVLTEGEQDPGVGEPWPPTTVLRNIFLFIWTSNSLNPSFWALDRISGAVQQCKVCCHINSVIMFILLQACRSSCQCTKKLHTFASFSLKRRDEEVGFDIWQWISSSNQLRCDSGKLTSYQYS